MALSGETFISTPIGDLFAPFFRVAFQAGTTNQLNTDSFVTDPNVATTLDGNTLASSSTENNTLVLTAQNLSKYASSLTIESKAQGLRMFTLVMTPPYEDAITLVDNRLIRQGSLVKCQWGYTSAQGLNDDLSDIHIFYNDQPKVAYSSQDVTITLTGYDIFSANYDRRTTSRLWNITQYPNDASVLLKIFEDSGFDASLISPANTPRLYVPLFTGPTSPATTTFMGRIQDVSDWSFVRRICNENMLWFEVLGKTIIFHDLNVLGGQPSKYNFVFRIPPMNEFDMPIWTFTANANQRAFLPPGAFETILHTSDPDTKTFVSEIKQPPTDTTRKTIGPTQGNLPAQSGGGLGPYIGTSILDPNTNDLFNLFPVFAPNTTGVHYPGPINQPRLSEAVESQRLEAQFYANDSAALTCAGIPNLMGQAIITVDPKGVGRSFGGPYLVTDVVHTISTDGYAMRLELKRTTGLNEPGTVVTNQPNPTTDTVGSSSATPSGPDVTTGGKQ
jgi:hypothetical protein